MQETKIEATKIVHFKFLVTVNLTVFSSFSSKSRVFFEHEQCSANKFVRVTYPEHTPCVSHDNKNNISSSLVCRKECHLEIAQELEFLEFG